MCEVLGLSGVREVGWEKNGWGIVGERWWFAEVWGEWGGMREEGVYWCAMGGVIWERVGGVRCTLGGECVPVREV